MPNSKQDFNDILNAISASGNEYERVRDEDHWQIYGEMTSYET